jgi:endonuclease III related protein
MDANTAISLLEKNYKRNWENQNKRKLCNWWPVSGNFKPSQLEIAIGAILTQNTSWNNAVVALGNMESIGLIDAKTIFKSRKLRGAIKPAGFFVQKSIAIKELCKLIDEFDGDFFTGATRDDIISLKGIGNETADSIMLYACGRPEFVIDAYTIRIFSRLGLMSSRTKYMQAKNIMETLQKKDVRKYKEIHALIVEHAKKTCKKKPLCEGCILANGCQKIMER